MYCIKKSCVLHNGETVDCLVASIQKYCHHWKLTGTKKMIFGKRKLLKDKYCFTYAYQMLEIVLNTWI